VAVIGFVPNANRPGAVELAEETSSWLDERGHKTRIMREADGPFDVDDLDLAVSLGGDGSMLRTVSLVRQAAVPVLGVNFGHLGYLTTVEPDGLRQALERWLAGDYRLEHRMTIDGRILDKDSGEELEAFTALNDVILTRPLGAHTIRGRLSLSGAEFLTYVADSMIVASATGSTAYNLSARGPIVSPRVRALVVTPVAPHMLFDRSLVLSESEDVSFETLDEFSAEYVVDGTPSGRLRCGQILECGAGARDALLVTFGERDFHHVLKRKFNLADR
jgi:NAD+ kinase